MLRIYFFVFIFFTSVNIFSQNRKVLMIGIDGCRPDALNLAHTPNIDSLIANGAFSLQAQTGNYTVSGAGWANTFTGVWESKHNITSNAFTSPNLANFPHFFSLIKQSKPEIVTASVDRWKINNYILSDGDYFTQRNVNDFSDSMNARLAANFLTHGFKPNYVHNEIPYNFYDISFLGSYYEVILNDDEVSAPINIGFNFDYFGSSYNELYISSNGYVSFSPPNTNNTYNGSGCCESENLPDAHYPNNVIALGWEDLDPPEGGKIFAATLGTAPNRYCIIQFNEIEHTQSSNHVTSQIVLRETSNDIEIHIKELQSDGGFHSIGVENIDGSTGTSISFSKNNIYQKGYLLQFQNQNLDKDPDVLFVYFRDVDEKGHDHGFDVTVSEYMSQIEKTDLYIKRIIDSLESRPSFENEEWLITVSTDHGGLCDTHLSNGTCNTGHHTGFQNHPEVKTIFYILSNKNYTVKGPIFPPPNIVDVIPSIMDFLCIDIDPNWQLDGQSRGILCPKPIVDFDFQVNGLNVDFYDSIENKACDSFNILWDFDDGILDSTNNPNHNFNGSGTYNVCLNATNECGTNQICKSLTFLVINGINKQSDRYISVYPNPFKENVNISFENITPKNLRLFDISGKLIWERPIIGDLNIELPFQDLDKGQYCLVIETETVPIHKYLIKI